MAEDTKAQIEPEKTTQDAPMPSADQKTPEPDVQAEVALEGVSQTESKEEGLPEDAKERTKRVVEEALNEAKTYREQLREERVRREYYESVFQGLQPKQEQQGLMPIYDPDTGLIDDAAVAERDRLTLEAKNKADKTERDMQELLQRQEEEKTYSAYPELNPNNKAHDKKFHAEVRRVMTDSMFHPEDYDGKSFQDMKEAADYIKGVQSSQVETAKKEGAEEAMKQLEPKEQASLEATGTPGRRTEGQEDLEELQERTRHGDIEATVERLKRLENPK